MTVSDDTVRIPRILGDVREQHPPVIGPAADPSPVFVDPSGRRQRRVRRLGRLLVVPAAAYLALLVSTVLGGPTIDNPLIPLPQQAHQAETSPSVAPAQSPPPSSATATTSSPQTSNRPSATDAAVNAGTTARSSASSTDPVSPTSTAPTAPTTPAASATPTPTHGHASAPPGPSRKPTHP